MIRPRQKFVNSILFLLILTLILLTHKEDIREIPDRWHGPFLNPEPASSLRSPTDIFTAETGYKPDKHPIEDLIEKADSKTKELAEKQTYNISATAAAYRQRRGRHPPPDFDKWFEYVVSHDCLIIEDFFDQIYRDIEPFWALSATSIRDAAATLPNTLRIRNGKMKKTTSEWPFVNAYVDMLKQIESYLPDVDLPINEMDESRILLPWEDVNELVSHSTKGRDLHNLPSITSFDPLDDHPESVIEHSWLREGPYWNIARDGCHPKSPGRVATPDADFSTPPKFPSAWPEQTHKGFVLNWTIAKDPCIHTHLRNTQGSFVEPISQSTTTKLLPIFSGSKLTFNNDILLPGAVYWHEDDRFSINNARIPWSHKRSEVLWRGSASGGRNTGPNWTRFHRHRLLSMLNGTQIQMTIEAHHAETASQEIAEGQSGKGASSLYERSHLPYNFPFPNQSLYPLRSLAQGVLPDWIRSLSNAAFTWLVCFPATRDYGCNYTGSWYRRGGEMPLYRMFQAKYLPDVDGNSFSGRYRAFLKSNSLPIKATIYNEWHDDRLVAWKHFVPMDNTFVDLWAILEYFVSHDDSAQKIALEGRYWADKVLRREDMLAYVYRLILEYARVSSIAREKMGWVADMKGM
jgi:Glycosyl transferase family 90